MHFKIGCVKVSLSVKNVANLEWLFAPESHKWIKIEKIHFVSLKQ